MRSGLTDGQFQGKGGQCGEHKTNNRNTGGKEKTRIYRHRRIKMCNIVIRLTSPYAGTSVSQWSADTHLNISEKSNGALMRVGTTFFQYMWV